MISYQTAIADRDRSSSDEAFGVASFVDGLKRAEKRSSQPQSIVDYVHRLIDQEQAISPDQTLRTAYEQYVLDVVYDSVCTSP